MNILVVFDSVLIFIYVASSEEFGTLKPDMLLHNLFMPYIYTYLDIL